MTFSRVLSMIITLLVGLAGFPLTQNIEAAAATQGFTVWSVGGSWTCDGKPTSITQDGGGHLVFTNQWGWRSKGHFLNTDVLIADDWENGLRGDIQDGGNTIRWANGTAWFRNGSGPGQGSVPQLAGAWTCSGRPTSITQDASGNLVFTNENGLRSKGRFENAGTVIALEWENGLRGSLQDGGIRIQWANGTAWLRKPATGQAIVPTSPLVPSLPSLAGTWTSGGRLTSITQDASANLVFINENGLRSKGRFESAGMVIALEWENGLRGSLQDGGNKIQWANGTAWFRNSSPVGQHSRPSLAGAWTSGGRPTSITQDASGSLLFINENGLRSSGRFADAGTVIATEWENGLRGSLQDNGNTIRWANGTVWHRSSGKR